MIPYAPPPQAEWRVWHAIFAPVGHEGFKRLVIEFDMPPDAPPGVVRREALRLAGKFPRVALRELIPVGEAEK